jgi:hypothetical protein
LKKTGSSEVYRWIVTLCTLVDADLQQQQNFNATLKHTTVITECFTCLYICGLFNDAVVSSAYTTVKHQIMNG